MMMTLEEIRKQLKVIEAAHEAQWILDHYKKYPNFSVPLSSLLERRMSGEPLAYLFGEWPFCDCDFSVGPGVLIPRPETEELVELVLKNITEEKKEFRVADLGAGSGCLGISVARGLQKKFPNSKICLELVEISPEARAYLSKNLKHFSEAKVFEGSWLEWFQARDAQKYDLLLSNPPYVTSVEYEGLDKSVAHFEPKLALVGDEDLLKGLVEGARSRLAQGGQLWIEASPAWTEFLNGQAFKTISDLSKKKRFYFFS